LIRERSLHVKSATQAELGTWSLQ